MFLTCEVSNSDCSLHIHNIEIETLLLKRRIKYGSPFCVQCTAQQCQHSVYALSDLVKRIFQFSYFSIRFFMTCSNNHFICYSYINFTTSDHKFFLRSAIKRLKVTQSSSLKKFDQKFGYFQKHSSCNTFLLLSVTESCLCLRTKTLDHKMASKAFKQDLPPEGGYAPVNFKRIPARTIIQGNNSIEGLKFYTR